MHEIYEISWNLWKSMKIDETAASWNWVKVSLGASFRRQRVAATANPGPLKSMENLRNYMKSSEIHWNQWKCMKSIKLQTDIGGLGTPNLFSRWFCCSGDPWVCWCEFVFSLYLHWRDVHTWRPVPRGPSKGLHSFTHSKTDLKAFSARVFSTTKTVFSINIFKNIMDFFLDYFEWFGGPKVKNNGLWRSLTFPLVPEIRIMQIFWLLESES